MHELAVIGWFIFLLLITCMSAEFFFLFFPRFQLVTRSYSRGRALLNIPLKGYQKERKRVLILEIRGKNIYANRI